MTKTQPRRKTTRLRGFDYAQEGAYFVTVCSHDKTCLFGDMIGDEVHLNALGKIVRDEWLKTSSIRQQCILDEFVVMPNHLHAILLFSISRGVLQYAPTDGVRHVSASTLRSPSQTLGAVIRGWKGAVTKRINLTRSTPGAPVWQRNYYEHVIRNERDLHETRRYIQENPARWALSNCRA